MFLYLGDGKYKRRADIIGIFDMDTATVSSVTRRFLSVNERKGRVESDGELPKSFLLCVQREKGDKESRQTKKCPNGQKKEYSVFLSRLSSTVLAARTATVRNGIEEE